MATSKATRGRKWTKNKKKGWRNIQNEDVEEYLELERLEERTGGPLGFAVDEKTTQDVPVRLTRKQKWESKELKCYSSIGPSSLAPPARIPHNVPVVKEKSLKKKKKTQKEIKAEEDRKRSLAERRKRKRESQPCRFNYSLWGDTPDTPECDEHYQVVTKKRKPNVPGYRYQKPSALPTVEVPHPGASYNPAADDWQELLQEAHEVEVKKDKETQRLHRALEAKFPTADQAPTEKTWMTEMSGGLFEGSDESEEDTEVVLFNDPSRLSVNKAVTRDRAKSSKQHKRKHELKLEKAKAEKEMLERAKHIDLRHNFKEIKSSIEKKEAEQQVKAEERAKKAEEAKFKTKRLGSMKFEMPDIEVQLSDELAGSLREMKPEGNLLADRFNSLIKRNVIEPRGRARRRRKYKLKTYEKKGHKEITA